MIWSQNIIGLLKNKTERHLSNVFTFMKKNYFCLRIHYLGTLSKSVKYRIKYNSLDIYEEDYKAESTEKQVHIVIPRKLRI